jgi:hypothetical protein
MPTPVARPVHRRSLDRHNAGIACAPLVELGVIVAYCPARMPRSTIHIGTLGEHVVEVGSQCALQCSWGHDGLKRTDVVIDEQIGGDLVKAISSSTAGLVARSSQTTLRQV